MKTTNITKSTEHANIAAITAKKKKHVYVIDTITVRNCYYILPSSITFGRVRRQYLPFSWYIQKFPVQLLMVNNLNKVYLYQLTSVNLPTQHFSHNVTKNGNKNGRKNLTSDFPAKFRHSTKAAKQATWC